MDLITLLGLPAIIGGFLAIVAAIIVFSFIPLRLWIAALAANVLRNET